MTMTAIVPRPQIQTELTMQPAVAETIAQALKESQPLAADYHKALDRAVRYLQQGYSYELRGAHLTCTSMSSPMTYETTLDDCECAGHVYGSFCLHRALLTICLSYQTLHAAATAVVAVRREQPTTQALRGVRHVETPLYVAPGPRTQRMSDAEYESLCAQLEREGL